MKRIILSVSTLAIVGVLVVGATTAFFSDTETSQGNTFSAGSIDLVMSNESYLQTNGVIEPQENLSWNVEELDDIGEEDLFFSFDDIKPGDLGEDTISLRVDTNDAWACMAADVVNSQSGSGDGEGVLEDEIQFAFWADDGDNVYEEGEEIIWDGPISAGDLFDGEWKAIADSVSQVFESEDLGDNGELNGEQEYHIAKAWCHGDLEAVGAEEGDDNPFEREETGFTCNGAPIGNDSQGDSFDVDIDFHAVQSRNNQDFECSSLGQEELSFFELVDDEQESPGLDDNNEDEPTPGAEEEDQPWIEWDTDTAGEITFTFHNPTPWLYVFDVQVDGESGTDRDLDNDGDINTDLQISDPPLAPQEFGPTYQRVVVSGPDTVSQTFSGTNEIRVGLREGAEQHGYIDWITFEAN